MRRIFMEQKKRIFCLYGCMGLVKVRWMAVTFICLCSEETDDGTGLAAWNWIAEKIKDNE